MEYQKLIDIITNGEDTEHQFKENYYSPDALAADLVAMSNSRGGYILVGVKDDNSISGLTDDQIRYLNQLISNVSSASVKPSINPFTEIFKINDKRILIIEIPKGINKPYQDKNGIFWVKSGSDKRKAISREELQRLFQNSGMIHGDAMPVDGFEISDIDLEYFNKFYNKRFESEPKLPLPQLLNNLYLSRNNKLNLTCALLFPKQSTNFLPIYIVKAVAFPGNSIDDNNYISSRDISGKLEDIYNSTIYFLKNNIKYLQNNQSFNSVGQPEIPNIVFEELVVNALVHRDYYIPAPIKVFVFTDRIEIISPGSLCNNLSVENIKKGNSNSRNPILTSFAYQILPYKGIGSGILRALKAYPNIEFINDTEANLFKVIIKRNNI